MTNQEIVDYVFNTPENVNSNVLKDIIVELNNSAKQEILNYVLKTPENFNPNILKDILDSQDVYYNVQISLTNPEHPEHFGKVSIFELIEDNYNTGKGKKIGEITSPTGNITVLINSKLFGIVIELRADGGVADAYTWSRFITCSGGILLSENNTPTMSNVLCQVTGDGTITLNKIDYSF